MKAVAGGQPEHGGQPDLGAWQPRCAWRLRELMAVRRNWFNTTKLVPELRRHGFNLDRSSVYRLVSAEQPPKIPLELVVALCKILDCRFEDLVVELDPEQGSDRPTTRGPAPTMPNGPGAARRLLRRRELTAGRDGYFGQGDPRDMRRLRTTARHRHIPP